MKRLTIALTLSSLLVFGSCVSGKKKHGSFHFSQEQHNPPNLNNSEGFAKVFHITDTQRTFK